MSDRTVTPRRGGGGGGGGIKMCEGWLEHRNHTLHGRIWQRIWLVLRGNVIYVFKTNDATQENQLGNLTIDRDTTFQNLPKGDQKNGYKFELKTGRRLNKFKTFKSSQREEWRAYVMALAKGTVPGDIDLLPPQVAEIQRKVDAHLKGNPHRESTYSGGSQESGIGSVGGQSGISGISRPYPGSSSGGSSGSPSRGSSSQMDMGGPFMVHRFWPDRSDQRVPSWFFSNCSRHQAEEILLNCRDYGNTLIRESSTHKSNGSYVISKSFFNESKKRYEVEHYEVMRVAVGYRINVENQQPEMTCLSAVMEYFVSTAGGSSQAMTTHDPTVLGLREPDYITRRIRGPPEEPRAEPWQWPPPDYDNMEDRRTRGASDSRTVNAAVMYNRHGGQSQAQASDRRWSSGQQQPATMAYYPRRQDSRSETRMDDIEHRVHQAEAISGLDDVIRGFQQDQLYVNADAVASEHEREEFRPKTPPPPPPHRPASHNYVNEGDGQPVSHADTKPPPPPPTPQRPTHHGLEDSTIRSLPEAPPPPTYRANKAQVAVSSQSPAHPTSTSANAQAQTPHLHNSPSDPTMKPNYQTPTPGKFIHPPLKKSVSENVFKTNPKSPGSPASFPSWTEPKSVLKKSSVNSQNSAQSDSDTSGFGSGSGTFASASETSGIDDTNPGGVSDLKSRFEKRPVSSIVQSQTSPTAKASPAPTRVVRPISWSLEHSPSSTSLANLPANSRGMRSSASFDNSTTNTLSNYRTNTTQQRPLPSTPDSPDNWVAGATDTTNTVAGGPSYHTRQRVVHEEDEGDIYDDTAVGDTVHPTEKKVAFEQVDPPSSTTRTHDEQRKTEPAISIPKGQFQGFRGQTVHQEMPMPPLPKRTSHDSPDGKTDDAPRSTVAPPPPHFSAGNEAIPLPPPPPPTPGEGVQTTWKQQQQQQAPHPSPATGRADSHANRALPPRPIMDDQSDFQRSGMLMATRRGRRQTEPAILVAPPDTSSGQPHGLNLDFKRMLDAKLRGDMAGLSGGPATNTHGTTQLPEDDGDYAAIEPDAVTYLDDEFNA